MMKTLAIALLAGAASLTASGAKASDIYVSDGYANPEMVQQVRLVCDQSRQLLPHPWRRARGRPGIRQQLQLCAA